MKPIWRLYPQPAEERPLNGTYLDHNIRGTTQLQDRPFVYTNYVVSIDGRIAIQKSGEKGMTVPQSTSNDRDWRLFQELAFQADVIVSSGRYLRDLADGKAQELLNTDDERFVDLREWRAARNLPPRPAVAVVSNSLDFNIPDQLKETRQVFIFTSAASDKERRTALEPKVDGLFMAGKEDVDGRQMVEKLGELGQRVIYNASGPKIFHMLLTAKVVDRLYLTYANRLLGGTPFSSIVEGPLLEPAVDLYLNTIYLDPYALDDLGQLFISYNIERNN